MIRIPIVLRNCNFTYRICCIINVLNRWRVNSNSVYCFFLPSICGLIPSPTENIYLLCVITISRHNQINICLCSICLFLCSFSIMKLISNKIFSGSCRRIIKARFRQIDMARYCSFILRKCFDIDISALQRGQAIHFDSVCFGIRHLQNLCVCHLHLVQCLLLIGYKSYITAFVHRQLYLCFQKIRKGISTVSAEDSNDITCFTGRVNIPASYCVQFPFCQRGISFLFDRYCDRLLYFTIFKNQCC